MPDPSPSEAAAEAALRAFLGAGLQPSFGWDLADAVPLWAGKLTRFDYALVLEAADDWIMQGNASLPSLVEFTDLCVGRLRESGIGSMAQAALPIGAPGPCEECGGALTVIVDATPPLTLRPCSVCNPPGHFLWERRVWNPSWDRPIGGAMLRAFHRDALNAGTPATVKGDPSDPGFLRALTCPACHGGTRHPPGWLRRGDSSVQSPEDNPWCGTCRPDEWRVVQDGHRAPGHAYRKCKHPSCQARSVVERASVGRGAA